ncbi:MAG: glycosyltransferase family 4 protein, partial [Lachnospiraceae bacterium]|nr:glycosyltransferase family 4 protein [Lachnospiraceae bacterium]
MKILFLMEYPIDLPGGGQLSTWTLCDGLKKQRLEPVVACPVLLDRRRNVFDFKVVEYKSDENRERSKAARIRNFIGRIFSFFRIIKKEKPDIIHVSMSESLITFGFLRCLGLFKDIPFVYTDRGLAYGYRRHSKLCIKKTMKHAAAMICTTEFNRQLWLKEKMSVPITVIPNTISTAFDIYDVTKRPVIRAGHGIAEDDFVIGFAGRISEEKDWDLVPVLVKAVKEAGVDFKVALVLSVYEEQDEGIAE